MSAPVIAVPVSPHQLASLASLDAWLAHGPKYGRNAAMGAVAGLAFAYFGKGRKNKKLKYAVMGAGATLAGSFLFFQLAKWASGKEHQVLASAAPAIPASAVHAHVAPPAAIASGDYGQVYPPF